MEREKEEMGGKRYPSSPNAYLLAAACTCMGRRPETRRIYKRNETEMDGCGEREGRDGGKRYPSSPNAYLLTATCICMGRRPETRVRL